MAKKKEAVNVFEVILAAGLIANDVNKALEDGEVDPVEGIEIFTTVCDKLKIKFKHKDVILQVLGDCKGAISKKTVSSQRVLEIAEAACDKLGYKLVR